MITEKSIAPGSSAKASEAGATVESKNVISEQFEWYHSSHVHDTGSNLPGPTTLNTAV